MRESNSRSSRPDQGPSNGKARVGLAARKVAATVLMRTLDDQRGLDSLLDAEHGLGTYQALIAKDRALVRAIVTTALRHKGEIDYALSKGWDRKPPKNARFLNHMLSVGAAQILFMDVPDSAAVNLAVTAIDEDKRARRFKNFANAVLRRLGREKEAILVKLGTDESLKRNLPKWMFKRLQKAFGKERAVDIVKVHASEPSLDLTVKTDAAGWAKRLDGIVLPTGTVRLLPKGPVPQLQGFEDGEWWVQDTAATLPAKLIVSAFGGTLKGKRVADLCAAPGGKTAQLAQAEAQVTAVDISGNRLKRLGENLARLKLEAELVEADLLEWEPSAPFDAILLDAPCSSTGTIRRHPDVAWTKSEDDIAQLAALQEQLWRRALGWLKPDGVLVFANCSLDRSEGEDIYARLLQEGAFVPYPVEAGEIGGLEEAVTGQGTVRTLPSMLANKNPRLAGMDGFFAARMRPKS